MFEFISENILFILVCVLIFYVALKSNYYAEHFEQKSQKTLTLYYAPWCPHCKSVKPIFDDLQKTYANVENVTILTVNGDEEPERLKEEKIKGYPTITLTIDEKVINYEGERTAQKLQEFIQSY